MKSGVRLGGVFRLECREKRGGLKWVDEAPNLVTNAGLQHILDVTFSGSSQTSTWYVGLADNSPSFSAASTLATPGGWTEFDEYSEGARQEYVEVRASQTLSNSASTAAFSITTAGGGVGGAFLAAAATGTSAILMCGAALTGGNRTVADGDTVNVTYTFTAADDGA